MILIHISAKYKGAITAEVSPYRVNLEISLLYNTLTRFAVPCFMMLSGAFLLSDEKNANYAGFYKKNLCSIAIPTAIFSVVYFVLSEYKTIRMREESDYCKPLIELLKGNAYYHLWYMYVLIGVYFFIPIIMRVKQDIDEKNFARASWIYLVVAMFSYSTTKHFFAWSLCHSICYVGFIMVGYQIKKFYDGKKNTVSGVIYICLGFLVEFVIYLIQYKHTMAGISEAEEVYSLIGNFNPLVVLAAILIFAGFAQLRIQNDIVSKLSKHTFYIYLLHVGVLEVFFVFQQKLFGELTDPVITIPIGLVFVFAVSLIGSIVYQRIWIWVISCCRRIKYNM